MSALIKNAYVIQVQTFFQMLVYKISKKSINIAKWKYVSNVSIQCFITQCPKTNVNLDVDWGSKML